MNTFHDLFQHKTRWAGVGPVPDRRPLLFPGFVERSPKLHLWSPDMLVPETGPRLLLGVATWSGYDAKLLDLLEELPSSAVRVDVFDIDTCQQPGDLDRYVPGAAPPNHTPLVGYWLDGKLVESASGFHGRQLVARVCGIPFEEVQARMDSLLPKTQPHAPS